MAARCGQNLSEGSPILRTPGGSATGSAGIRQGSAWTVEIGLVTNRMLAATSSAEYRHEFLARARRQPHGGRGKGRA
jgi:hypothetical protein